MNRMRTQIHYKIGFADGEVSSYQREEHTFTVVVKAWNGDHLRIDFSDPVGICDFGVGDISDFCMEDSGSEFMRQVLSSLYEVVPASHSYFLYQFLNLDDQPALEIVATGVQISPFEN